MNIDDIVDRNKKPEPWAEGDNIPWDDPGFSERMLKEHLSQAHDAASRRSEFIDRQVEWIHHDVLSGHPSRILDLGCGPGLYVQRLTTLGHQCTGIDFSPASISYAQKNAQEKQLAIHYHQEDIRVADFPHDQDLVLLLSGELNVFSPSDARRIVSKAAECLSASGRMILEIHATGVIQRLGQEARKWYSVKSGLWSDSPHLCLQENFWYPDRRTAITRYFVIDTTTGETTLHSASYQDYTDEEYESLLVESGYRSITSYPSLTGAIDEDQKDFTVLVAGK
ncbi:MAG: class I SAM-dependent methyltransferase [Planctomycetota bacterium]|jgi:SAM-dependent methyltransferase